MKTYAWLSLATIMDEVRAELKCAIMANGGLSVKRGGVVEILLLLPVNSWATMDI